MGRPRKFVDTPYAGDAGEAVAPPSDPASVVAAAPRSSLPAMLAKAKADGDAALVEAILAACSQ